MDASSLHIAMFPWFAMGHLTPFLHLSNKLAKKGHRISFFIPRKTQAKLEHFNLYPHLITFVPLTVPHVDGLPSDAETSSDVPFSLFPLIMTALDRTEKDIELHLQELKPDLVFFDFQYWIPNLARRLGIKSVAYWIANPATAAYLGSPERRRSGGGNLTAEELMQPPSGFPDSSIKLHPHETRFFAAARKWEFGSGVRLCDRVDMGIEQSDALAFKGCREMEGPFVDYLEAQFGKPVLLSGPVIPEPPTSTLEEKWVSWLRKFKAGSVIYCALGSEGTLQQNQFQELFLGLELTGMPFLAVLKPPVGFDTIEAAMPQGFEESVQGRGIVHGGWVQQQLILEHPSVGCFITHCGASSITESLVNECQLVLMPRLGSDHIFNARLMGNKLKVGVEVEKGEEDGLFTKEAVCKAVRLVMDEESEVGRDVRANHAKFRTLLLSNNLESSCIHSFCERLKGLLTKS